MLIVTENEDDSLSGIWGCERVKRIISLLKNPQEAPKVNKWAIQLVMTHIKTCEECRKKYEAVSTTVSDN